MPSSTLHVPHPRFPHSYSLPLGWVRAELTRSEGAADSASDFLPLSAVASVEAPVAFAVTVKETGAETDGRALLAEIAAREGFRIDACEDVTLPLGPALRAYARQGDTPDAASGWIVLFPAGGVLWSLIAIAPNALLEAHREAFETLFLSFRIEFEADPTPSSRSAQEEAEEAAALETLEALAKLEELEARAAAGADATEKPPALELVDDLQRLDPEIDGPDAPACVRLTPDGTHLVFAVPSGHGSEIWSGYSGTDRSNVRLLTIPDGVPRALRFAPGGRLLLCELANEVLVLDVPRREVAFTTLPGVHAWQPPHRDRHLGGVPLARETLWFVERGRGDLQRWESDLPGHTASQGPLEPGDANLQTIAPSPDGVQALLVVQRAESTALVLHTSGVPNGRTLLEREGVRRMRASWNEDASRVAVVVEGQKGRSGELLVFESLFEAPRKLAALTAPFLATHAVWIGGPWLAFGRGAALTLVDAETGTGFETALRLTDETELVALPGDRLALEDGRKVLRARFRGPFGTAPEELDDEEMPTRGIAPSAGVAWQGVACAQGAASLELPPGWETDLATLGADTPSETLRMVAAFAPRDRAATGARVMLLAGPLPARGAVVDILSSVHEALGFRERMQRDHDGMLDTLGVRSSGDAFWRMRSLLCEDGGELWLVVVECHDEAWHDLKRTLAHTLLSFRVSRPRGATLTLHRESLRRDDPRYEPRSSRR